MRLEDGRELREPGPLWTSLGLLEFSYFAWYFQTWAHHPEILQAVGAPGPLELLLGTIVGSTCLGVITAFAGFFFPEWITSTIFLIMIVLIIIRPQGILG